MFIKGETIVLVNRVEVGKDAFDVPIYETTSEEVENVLIHPISATEQTDTLNLTGALVQYQLGIPKTDTHDWRDVTVEFWGEKWRTVGSPEKGMDAHVPTEWNTKVKVQRYE